MGERPLHRVLVVDDHEDSVAVLVEVLRVAGFEPFGTSNALTAMSLATRVCPEVVVTDVAMPGLSGVELGRQLRANARTRDVKLIGLSGAAMADQAAPPQGWDGYLVKPVEPDELTGLIQRMLH